MGMRRSDESFLRREILPVLDALGLMVERTRELLEERLAKDAEGSA
jgi:hypothetical protein